VRERTKSPTLQTNKPLHHEHETIYNPNHLDESLPQLDPKHNDSNQSIKNLHHQSINIDRIIILTQKVTSLSGNIFANLALVYNQ
jgi:hypothetical protein